MANSNVVKLNDDEIQNLENKKRISEEVKDNLEMEFAKAKLISTILKEVYRFDLGEIKKNTLLKKSVTVRDINVLEAKIKISESELTLINFKLTLKANGVIVGEKALIENELKKQKIKLNELNNKLKIAEFFDEIVDSLLKDSNFEVAKIIEATQESFLLSKEQLERAEKEYHSFLIFIE